jgi:hypothetical protein
VRSKWLEWTPEAGLVGFEASPSAVSPITRDSIETKTQIPAPRCEGELIQESAHNEPTKPTEPDFLDLGMNDRKDPATIPGSEPHPCQVREDRDAKPRENNRESLPTDAYAERLRAAMLEVAQRNSLGMIIWLREACSTLYAELLERLPDEIQRAWESRAPIEEFQDVVNIWLKAYRTGCEMYEQYQNPKTQAAP